MRWGPGKANAAVTKPVWLPQPREQLLPASTSPRGVQHRAGWASRAPIHLLPFTLGFGISCLFLLGLGLFSFFTHIRASCQTKLSLVLQHVFWYMSITSIFLLHLSKIGQEFAFFFWNEAKKNTRKWNLLLPKIVSS